MQKLIFLTLYTLHAYVRKTTDRTNLSVNFYIFNSTLSFSSCFCNLLTFNSLTSLFSLTANAAAVPAACPMAIHGGTTLTAAKAYLSAEMLFPAVKRFSILFEIKHDNGI